MNLDLVLGPHAFRLAGITATELPLLGRQNLLRIAAFVEENLLRGDFDAFERGEVIGGLNRLRELAADAASKPVLAPLRSGIPMRVGERVHVYLGDTPGEDDRWEPATVAAVVKDYKREWAATRDGGYYWRLELQLERGGRLACSSTEPRVIPSDEFRYLTSDQDPDFVKLYSKNAQKDWQPIWCIERRVEAPTARMDLVKWFRRATAS